MPVDPEIEPLNWGAIDRYLAANAGEPMHYESTVAARWERATWESRVYEALQEQPAPSRDPKRAARIARKHQRKSRKGNR